MKQNTFFVGGLTLITLFASCNSKRTTEQNMMLEPKHYKTEILKPQKVELKSDFPAVLKGQDDVEIKPRVDGFIEAVYVDEGAKVKKGQPLFKVNSPSSVKAF